MKVHLEMHDAKGVLFCGFVEAPSVVAAMTLKLQELGLTRHLQPGALRIEAKPEQASSLSHEGGREA